MADQQSRQDKQGKQGKANSGVDAGSGRPAAPAVNWDDSDMRTSYANVVNASSTREEMTLFFGTNLTWNPAEAKEFHVRLNDRIVLNPHAAKRLWILLGAILTQYESRFGELRVEGAGAEQASASVQPRGNSGTGKTTEAAAESS